MSTIIKLEVWSYNAFSEKLGMKSDDVFIEYFIDLSRVSAIKPTVEEDGFVETGKAVILLEGHFLTTNSDYKILLKEWQDIINNKK